VEVILANTKSALKRIKTSRKRQARNRAIRTATRTYVKRARAAIEGQASDMMERVREALSALDKAVSKGVIHRNNAARRKSRLMRYMQKFGQSA
jgi:small subunit ribosomal protein S20